MSNRRSMISRSGAMIGACLLGAAATPLKAETPEIDNDPIDVKRFGATGKREQNATKPAQHCFLAS